MRLPGGVGADVEGFEDRDPRADQRRQGVDNRASETLWISGPKMGGLSLKPSHLRRPSSVLIHFRRPMMPPTITAMTNRTQTLVTISRSR